MILIALKCEIWEDCMDAYCRVNTGFGSKLPDFLTAMARELSVYVGLIPADSEQLFGHEGVVLPRYAGRFGLKPHADEARFVLKYFFSRLLLMEYFCMSSGVVALRADGFGKRQRSASQRSASASDHLHRGRHRALYGLGLIETFMCARLRMKNFEHMFYSVFLFSLRWQRSW